MPSKQYVRITGHLSKDPEIRYSASGKAVANISVPVSEKWNDKNTGEKKEETEWFNCVAFGRTAEIIGEYLHKGDLVDLTGKMKTEKWQDKEGNERYTTKMYIDPFNGLMMLGSKGKQETKPVEPAQSQNDFDSQDIPF